MKTKVLFDSLKMLYRVILFDRMRQATNSSHPSDLIPKLNSSDPSLDISIAQVTR